LGALVIVESPSKAQKIKPYLGSDYTVVASMGHFRDLPQKGMGFEVKGNDLHIDFELYEDSIPLLKKIKSLAKSASKIYLATDPDREGECIAWHLIEYLGPHKYERSTWTEINKNAIVKAIQNPRSLDQNLVNAALCRRILDREIGYPITKFIRNKVDSEASGGRVQSVAVRLIVERDEVINNFKPVTYFNIKAIFNDGKNRGEFLLNSKLESYKNKKVTHLSDDKNHHIKTEEEANSLVENFKNGTWKIVALDEKDGQQKAPPPFKTGTMQQDASRLLRMSINDITVCAQKLYEAGLITYIRTDGTTISDDAIKMVREYIQENFKSDYLPPQPNIYKTKQKNAQEAHECIRPTHMTDRGESIQDPKQKALYELIWKRFLACQMTPVLKTNARCEIKNGDGIFVAKGSIVKFDGWRKIYSDTDDQKDEDEQNELLPKWVKAGITCGLEELKSQILATLPPPKFTEATLVIEMEKIGIGRPSTYSML